AYSRHNKATVKQLPALPPRNHSASEDLDEDSGEGSEADEEPLPPAIAPRESRQERPENLADATQASQFWAAERDRLASLHINEYRFVEPIDLEQQKRSVALFREVMSFPQQQRFACCVCAELKPSALIRCYRLPKSSPLDEVVNERY